MGWKSNKADSKPPYQRLPSIDSTASFSSTWSDRSLGRAGGFDPSAFTRRDRVEERRVAMKNLMRYNAMLDEKKSKEMPKEKGLFTADGSGSLYASPFSFDRERHVRDWEASRQNKQKEIELFAKMDQANRGKGNGFEFSLGTPGKTTKPLRHEPYITSVTKRSVSTTTDKLEELSIVLDDQIPSTSSGIINANSAQTQKSKNTSDSDTSVWSGPKVVFGGYSTLEDHSGKGKIPGQSFAT